MYGYTLYVDGSPIRQFKSQRLALDVLDIVRLSMAAAGADVPIEVVAAWKEEGIDA